MSLPASTLVYREMCRVDKYTDIYLQEIRTRRKIHKCLFSPPGARMCKRVIVRDHGKVYHTRRRYIEEEQEPPKMPSILPKHRVRESPSRPLKLVRSKTSPVITTVERSPSFPAKRDEKETEIRSHPVRFGIPFLSRASEREERKDRDRDWDWDRPRPRYRRRREEYREEKERTARPFVVEAPEEYNKYRRRQSPRPLPTPSPSPSRSPLPQRHRHRRTQSDSPRRARSPRRTRSPTPDRRGSVDLPSRQYESRRPRETSPVAERVPLRRSHRVVEVHNPERPRSRSWSRTREDTEDRPQSERRVRFANDDKFASDDSGQTSSVDEDEYDIIKERSSRRHCEQERHIREPSPWPGRPDRPEKQKPGGGSSTITRNMPPPRIVQDGCQRVSGSTANNDDHLAPKIELRRPRSRAHARFRRGSGSLEPESEPDDSTVVCDADHWRYGGRWR